MLKKWIQPKWKDTRLSEVRPLMVEKWLKSLPPARKTKKNVRNLMHVLFECSRRWELVSQNPVELVRQKGRRRKTPRRLTTDELRGLLAQLDHHAARW